MVVENYYVGDAIVIKTLDDFKIKTIRVSIFQSDGSLIEQGVATIPLGEIVWTYVVTVASQQVAGTKYG